MEFFRAGGHLRARAVHRDDRIMMNIRTAMQGMRLGRLLSWARNNPWWCALGVGLLVLITSITDAEAHRDLNFETSSGHYYRALGGPQYTRWPTPEEAGQDRANEGSGTYCGVHTAEGQWFVEICLGGCTNFCNDIFIGDQHCPLGQGPVPGTSDCAFAEQGGVVVGQCKDTRGLEHQTTNVGEPPQFANAAGCLWERQSYGEQVGTPNCYDVTWRNTGWLESDHDGWTGQSPTSGNPIGSFGQICGQQPEGGGIPGVPPVGESGTCPVDVDVYGHWPYDENEPDSMEAPETMCRNGCRIVHGATDPSGAVQVCIGEHCAAWYHYNGELCDGQEDYVHGSGEGWGGAAGTGEGEMAAAGVEAELRRIYDRLGRLGEQAAAIGAAQIGAIVGTGAAVVGAIEGSGNGGNGGGDGGECVDESCPPDMAEGDSASDYEDTAAEVVEGVEGTGWVTAASNVIGELPPGACPTWSSDPVDFLDGWVGTVDIHCELWPDIESVVAPIMLSVWATLGVIIVLRA